MPRIILMFALLIALIAGCGGSVKPMRASDPNLSQAHMERAKFFWAQGELNKTIQEMEWAINANPYNYEAAYNLGLIYLDQGQRISARRVWDNALSYMEDGDGAQMEHYDNARKAAEIKAALAELDKAERQLGSPEAILARQQGQIIAEATIGQAGGTNGTGEQGGTTAIAPSGSSQADSALAGSGKPGQYQPRPYMPSTQDSKPAPSRAQSNRAGSGGQRPSDCPPCAPQSSGKYAIQVSSNQQQKNAQRDVSRLTGKGYHATIASSRLASGTWHVVWAGCCTSREQAQKLAADLIKQGVIPRDARVAIPPKQNH